MNIYLYPWHTDDQCSITKVLARNFQDCEDKVKDSYINMYDDLDDLLDFDDFCSDLYEKHRIIIGDIFEINEFM